jgi:hypothetical protein
MNPVARHDNLLTQSVGNELVIYDQSRHRVHRLNETAAAIWNGCDGKTTITDLATLLPSELEATPDVVWMALDKLGKAHLLESNVELPSEVADPARRTWMRRMAFAGGAALLLPVVASMSAPTPAMAQSGEPPVHHGGGDDDDDTNVLPIVAAGAAVAAVAGSGGGGGGGDTGNNDAVPCATRVPGGDGGGCTGAPCGPGLRCLPSLTDPSKCVCR